MVGAGGGVGLGANAGGEAERGGLGGTAGVCGAPSSLFFSGSLSASANGGGLGGGLNGAVSLVNSFSVASFFITASGCLKTGGGGMAASGLLQAGGDTAVCVAGLSAKFFCAVSG